MKSVQYDDTNSVINTKKHIDQLKEVIQKTQTLLEKRKEMLKEQTEELVKLQSKYGTNGQLWTNIQKTD